MRQSLELKVPPAIVFAGALFAVWLLSRLSEPDFWWGLELAGLLLIGVGALVIVAATLQFRRHRTTLDPREPDKATALLTQGIFAFSRNPIYLAFGLIVLGCALAVESVAALIVAPLYMAYLQLFQIKPEEAYLQRKFGQRYQNYCQRTRRWLGRAPTDDAR